MAKTKQESQQPLILRAHRLMEAFAKSDDERDFYLDRNEGFLIYLDLDKPKDDVEALEKEIQKNSERYCMIPKLTFYETKKIMEGFVNEKVYDIDTKEKLLDIIQSKEARSNFLEFIYDHHTEMEKWQQYYQERSRIRIIEWLRLNHFHFVFEEDLEFAKNLLEKLKQALFQSQVGKDVSAARKILITKAKSYYSNEALNPRPKRGRPPKQVAKQEIESQGSRDVYLSVPAPARPFLFAPEISSSTAVTFAADFETPEALAARRHQAYLQINPESENLEHKLASLRRISSRWVEDEEDEDEDEDEEELPRKAKASVKKPKAQPAPKKAPKKAPLRSILAPKAKAPIKGKYQPKKRIMPMQKVNPKKNVNAGKKKKK